MRFRLAPRLMTLDDLELQCLNYMEARVGWAHAVAENLGAEGPTLTLL